MQEYERTWVYSIEPDIARSKVRTFGLRAGYCACSTIAKGEAWPVLAQTWIDKLRGGQRELALGYVHSMRIGK
jgi:hypothetical protein